MTPKVSVIVPVYNVEKYLSRCMDSILNQTLKDIEIILVDDKSPDNSPQMCDEYTKVDKRVKVIHKPINEGLGFARNTGLSIAQGEYVAFIDSDDFVTLDYFETLYNLAKLQDYDAVYSEFNNQYYPGYTIIEKPEAEYCNKKEVETLMLDMIGPEPSFPSDVKFQVSSCKVLYAKAVIDANNLRFKSEREFISEDLLFNLEFLKCCQKVKYVPMRLYYYCLNGASLSHTYKPEIWTKLQKMLSGIQNLKSDISNQTEFDLRIQRLTLFYVRGALSSELFQNKQNPSKRKSISRILSDKVLAEALKSYPGNQLPWKHKLFFYALKYKSYSAIYSLLFLQHIR